MSLFMPALSGALHRETITVITVTEGPPGPWGEATTTSTTRDYTGFNVQPVGTAESIGEQTVITSRHRVSGPFIPGMDQATTIRWRGQDFDIEGESQHYVSGAMDHMELIISRSTPG